jgi:hypothetical protein
MEFDRVNEPRPRPVWIHNLAMLFNNSRYFGQNNRDSKIRIILINITDARCGDL